MLIVFKFIFTPLYRLAYISANWQINSIAIIDSQTVYNKINFVVHFKIKIFMFTRHFKSY